MRVHTILLLWKVVCAKFAHCFLAQQMVFANFATTTILQILQIAFPTFNIVHDLHVIRLVMYANFAHVLISFNILLYKINTVNMNPIIVLSF